MRIAVITETWLPSVDGVVTRLRNTVRELTAAGHDLLIMAPTIAEPINGIRQIELPGIVLPFVDRRRRVGVPTPWPVPPQLTSFDPDVIHVVDPILMGWAALRAIGGRHATVVSFHTDFEAYLPRYRLGALRPVLRALMRSSYGRADLALATSPAGQQRLLTVGSPSTIWRPAVDADLFGPGPGTATRPDWLSDDPSLPTVLCVGRLAPEKNLHRLAPILALAARSPRPWHLTFIGDGPERGRLEQHFSRLPATFAGARSAPDVAAAYRAADALLMPSLTETVGLVLLEAAACALPIVAADTAAVRHTVPGSATLVAPTASANTWATAVADTLDRPRPAPVTAASWREVTDELTEAYRSVAQSRHSGRPGRAGTPVP